MIPQRLKGVLWSRRLSGLSLRRDQEYIIHQVLIYGTFRDWRWLFKTYGFNKVKGVFLTQPLKIYPPMAFNFIKKILFDLPDRSISSHKYIETPISN